MNPAVKLSAVVCDGGPISIPASLSSKTAALTPALLSTWIRLAELPAEDRDVVILDACGLSHSYGASSLELNKEDTSKSGLELYDTVVDLDVGISASCGYDSLLTDEGSSIPLPMAKDSRAGWLEFAPSPSGLTSPLVAYSLTVPIGDDVTLLEHHPSSWRLQGSQSIEGEPSRWTDIDIRDGVTFPPAALSGTGGAATVGQHDTTLTFHLQRAAFCRRYRLLIRRTVGSAGGGHAQAVDACGAVLRKVHLWCIRADAALVEPSETTASASSFLSALGWGYRLVVSGPASARRLRLVSTDRLIDVMLLPPNDICLADREWHSLALSVSMDAGIETGSRGLRGTSHQSSAYSSRVLIEATIDGAPVAFLPMEAAANGTDSKDHGMFSIPAPPLLAAAFLDPSGRVLCVGGPAFRALDSARVGPLPLRSIASCEANVVIEDVPGAGGRLSALLRDRAACAAGVAGESGLCEDCDAYPSTSLACFRGQLSSLSIAFGPNSVSHSDLDAALRRDGPPSSKHVFPDLPGRIGPLRSLEHALVAHALQGTAEVAPRIPAVKRSSATVLTRSGLGRLAPHDGPVSLLCHDCGPAVYAEDAGSTTLFAPPQDVHAARLQAMASRPAAPRLLSERMRGGAVAPPSLPGAQKPLALSVREERLPLDVQRIIADAPSSALAPDSQLLSALREPLLVGHMYRLRYWQHCDIFCYFSHARLSIPPPGWVSAARAHGVPVLGTIITEWTDGESANGIIARQAALGKSSPDGISPLAHALASLCTRHGFDGWLVNVEASMPADHESGSAAMAAFVGQLTRAVHAALPDNRGCVLWYDSLHATSGTVAWHSELDPEANAPFLAACDGLFLDYHWDQDKLRRTHERARETPSPAGPASIAGDGSRLRDIAVGIDVWGRGMPGGGKWATRGALDSVAAAGLDDPGKLSIALFGPAWAYEACGGAQDANLFSSLESQLWSGAGDAPAGSPSAPSVLNACGILPPPSMGEGDRSAYLSHCLAGWEVTADGGNGWAAAECDPGAPGGGNGARPSCFVTSHDWCRARQIVWLPGVRRLGDAGATPPSVPQPLSLTVSEWYAGTGPNYGDTYYLTAWLVDAQGNPLGADPAGASAAPSVPPPPSATTFHSGFLTCAREWRRAAHTFSPLPPGAAGVVIEHGGKDSEHWAGHFGARMRGLNVSVPRPAHEADAAGLGCGLAYSPPPLASPLCADSDRCVSVPNELVGYAARCGIRPAAAILPLRTSFCDGVGAAVYRDGERVVDRPWTGLGETTLLPSFADHHASSGLGFLHGPCARGRGGALLPMLSSQSSTPGPALTAPSLLSASISHAVAWRGGSSLLIHGSVPLPPCWSEDESHAMALPSSGFGCVRVFALNMPLSKAQPAVSAAPSPCLRVLLVYRVETAHVTASNTAPSRACDASLVPLLLLSSAQLLAPCDVTVERAAGASDWRTATATFALPPSAEVTILELQLAACAVSHPVAPVPLADDAQRPINAESPASAASVVFSLGSVEIVLLT